MRYAFRKVIERDKVVVQEGSVNQAAALAKEGGGVDTPVPGGVDGVDDVFFYLVF